MQDHIPDALIAAFERQYDTSWNDPQLRNERLAMRYGWAAAMEAKQCLHQIQESAPATAMDALREAEAALEVAMARILKADPGHSISVTSEAKALVAVRAALADTPADHVEQDLNMVAAAAQVVLPEPDAYANPMDFLTLAKKEPAPWNKAWMFSTHYPELIGVYSADSVSALLATGGQAQAVEQAPVLYVSKGQLDNHSDPDGPDSANAGRYLPCRITPAGKFTTPLFAAPQAQADARDAEQERWMGIGKAIERACVDLPAGAEINIHLEKDAGTVTLSDCDGDEQENFPTDEGFAGVVNAAIDAAIAAAKGE